MKKFLYIVLFSILLLSWCGNSNELETLKNSNIKVNPSNSNKKDLLDVPVIQEEPHEIENYTIDWPISQ